MVAAKLTEEQQESLGRCHTFTGIDESMLMKYWDAGHVCNNKEFDESRSQ